MCFETQLNPIKVLTHQFRFGLGWISWVHFLVLSVCLFVCCLFLRCFLDLFVFVYDLRFPFVIVLSTSALLFLFARFSMVAHLYEEKKKQL